MIKKRRAEQPYTPTAWERSAAAVTWLSVNITFLAIILGMLQFFLLRKRRPFLALHGWRAALSQAIILCFVLALYCTAIFLGSFSDSFDYVLNGVIPSIMRSPSSASYYWSILSPSSRIILSVIGSITPTILLVSIIGALTAVFGHRQARLADSNTSLPAAITQ